MKRLIPFLCVTLLFACSKENEEVDQRQQIIDYLDANKHTAIETNSGLFYEVLKEGTGATAKSSSQVHVVYKGWLLNKSVFDQSDNSGAVFFLNQLIPAWREGIPKIRTGGKIMLFCPSKLGYGNQQVGSIPPNSVLIFEIDLRAVID